MKKSVALVSFSLLTNSILSSGENFSKRDRFIYSVTNSPKVLKVPFSGTLETKIEVAKKGFDFPCVVGLMAKEFTDSKYVLWPKGEGYCFHEGDTAEVSKFWTYVCNENKTPREFERGLTVDMPDYDVVMNIHFKQNKKGTVDYSTEAQIVFENQWERKAVKWRKYLPFMERYVDHNFKKDIERVSNIINCVAKKAIEDPYMFNQTLKHPKKVSFTPGQTKVARELIELCKEPAEHKYSANTNSKSKYHN